MTCMSLLFVIISTGVLLYLDLIYDGSIDLLVVAGAIAIGITIGKTTSVWEMWKSIGAPDLWGDVTTNTCVRSVCQDGEMMNRIVQGNSALSVMIAGENVAVASGLLRQPRVCYAPVTYISETTEFLVL